MDIKRKINFNLRAYGRKTINYQVRMRVSYHGFRDDYILGYSLLSEDGWDEESQMVKSGTIGVKNVGASTINEEIRRYREIIEDCFKYYEVNNIIPSTKELKARFLRKLQPQIEAEDHTVAQKEEPKQKTFWSIYKEFVLENSRKNDWTVATHQKFDALEKDLKAFRRDLTFESFTESGLTKFVCFLRDRKIVTPPKALKDDDGKTKGERVGLQNSTIEKKLSFLKWFLKWATKKGYNKNLEYQTFKPTLKTAQKPVIFLTEEEMRQLRDCSIPPEKNYLERVRDVFRLCCVTGLRYSDAYNLRRSDIKDGQIAVTTQKTTDSLNIPLNVPAKAILDKYRDVPFEGGKALPVISNQKMNEYLRELCQLAGIDSPVRITTVRGNVRTDEIIPKYRLITSHAGRRTFVTTMLSKGISAEVVMKITGHSNYAAMKPYVEIVSSARANAMQVLNEI